MECLCLIIAGIIVYFAWQYFEETKLERHKQKFDDFKKEMSSQGQHTRERMATQKIHNDLKELGEITKQYLEKYESEIPPRLFQTSIERINGYVANNDFDKLYNMYTLLAGTDKRKILSELSKFLNWS